VGTIRQQIVQEATIVLTSIAGLALLAGAIIIANAVSLAMLERRREIGILKALGYTSRTVLGQVLLEQGVIGGFAGLLAMVLVGLTLVILSQPALFGIALGVNTLLTLSLILGTALLAMGLAALVAWSATRVRPLEVLRYE
jgi:ABC-type antimicrobial peptide transport system permease subunit